MDPSQLVQKIDAELQAQADPSYRELVHRRYNMNVDHFRGVRTSAIHKIADKYYRTIKSENIDQRLALCEHLLEMMVYEHRITAFRWARPARKDYVDGHLQVFANWLDAYVDDWIDCDDLCIHVIGEFLVKYPDKAGDVVGWTRSPNIWMRRGAAVSLVLPIRRGQQLQLALQVTDRLLGDPEVLVQKGYGWSLKEASKAYAQDVCDYVVEKRDLMSRVAFRHAIEKLPEQLRRKALDKI